MSVDGIAQKDWIHWKAQEQYNNFNGHHKQCGKDRIASRGTELQERNQKTVMWLKLREVKISMEIKIDSSGKWFRGISEPNFEIGNWRTTQIFPVM